MTVPTMRITTPASMIALIDTMLGFRPANSIVVVLLAGTRVVVTARIDLTDLDDPKIGDQLTRAVAQTGADSVVAVVYDAAEEQRPAVGRTVDRLQQLGLTLVEHVVVAGDSYHSLLFGEGGSLDEVASDPISCERIYSGQTLAASREEILAQLEPGSAALPEGFDEAYAATEEAVATMTEDEVVLAVAELLDAVGDDEPDGHTIGRLAALGTHYAAAEPTLARIHRDDSQRWLDFWSHVVRAVEGPAAVLPLIASGCAAWAAGHGVLVNAAVDELADLDARHPMLRLLRTALAEALPPARWEAFRDLLNEGVADDAA